MTAPPVPSTHHLLLALAGRVDDDLLATARELVAIGEEPQALEILVATLVADRTALPAPLRAEVVELARWRGLELDAEALLGPAAGSLDGTRHVFGAGPAGGDERLAELLTSPPPGSTVRVTWRLTPAGAAPGPVPHPVVLVELTGPGIAPEVVSYRLGAQLTRSGLPASVETYTPADPLPAYQRAALERAREVGGGRVGAPSAAPAGPAGPGAAGPGGAGSGAAGGAVGAGLGAGLGAVPGSGGAGAAGVAPGLVSRVEPGPAPAGETAGAGAGPAGAGAGPAGAGAGSAAAASDGSGAAVAPRGDSPVTRPGGPTTEGDLPGEAPGRPGEPRPAYGPAEVAPRPSPSPRPASANPGTRPPMPHPALGRPLETAQPPAAFRPLHPRPDEGAPVVGGSEPAALPAEAVGEQAARPGPRPVPGPGPRPVPEGPRLPLGPVETVGPMETAGAQDEPRTTPFERTRTPGSRRSGPTLSVVPAAPGHEPPSGPRQAPVTRPTPVVRADESFPTPAAPWPVPEDGVHEVDPPVLASMRDPLSGPLREPLLDAQLDRARTGPMPIVGLTPPQDAPADDPDRASEDGPGAAEPEPLDAVAPTGEEQADHQVEARADDRAEALADGPGDVLGDVLGEAPTTGRRRRAEEPPREPAPEWTRDWTSGAWAMPERRRGPDLPAAGRVTADGDGRTASVADPAGPRSHAGTTDPAGPRQDGAEGAERPALSGDGDRLAPGPADSSDGDAGFGPRSTGAPAGEPSEPREGGRRRRAEGTPDSAHPLRGGGDGQDFRGGSPDSAPGSRTGSTSDAPAESGGGRRRRADDPLGGAADGPLDRTASGSPGSPGGPGSAFDPTGSLGAGRRRAVDPLLDDQESSAPGTPPAPSDGTGRTSAFPGTPTEPGRRADAVDRASGTTDVPTGSDLLGHLRAPGSRGEGSTGPRDHADRGGEQNGTANRPDLLRHLGAPGSRGEAAADPYDRADRGEPFGPTNGTARPVIGRRRAGGPTDGTTDIAGSADGADLRGSAPADRSRSPEPGAAGPTGSPSPHSEDRQGDAVDPTDSPLRIDPLDPLGSGNVPPSGGEDGTGLAGGGTEADSSAAGPRTAAPGPERPEAPAGGRLQGSAQPAVPGSSPGAGVTDDRTPGSRRAADPSAPEEGTTDGAVDGPAVPDDDAPTGRRAAKDGVPTIRPVPGGRRRARHRPDDAEPDAWNFAADAGPAPRPAPDPVPDARPDPAPRPGDGSADRADGLPPPRPVPRTIPRIRRTSDQPVSGLFGPGEVPPSRPDDPFGVGPDPARAADDEPSGGAEGAPPDAQPEAREEESAPEAYSSLSSREQDLLRLLQQELAVRESAPERRNGSGPYGPPDLAG